MDEGSAARYLGVTVSFLRVTRGTNPRAEGPPFVRIGKRGVRYLRADLDEWLASRRVLRPAVVKCLLVGALFGARLLAA